MNFFLTASFLGLLVSQPSHPFTSMLPCHEIMIILCNSIFKMSNMPQHDSLNQVTCFPAYICLINSPKMKCTLFYSIHLQVPEHHFWLTILYPPFLYQLLTLSPSFLMIYSDNLLNQYLLPILLASCTLSCFAAMEEELNIMNENGIDEVVDGNQIGQ